MSLTFESPIGVYHDEGLDWIDRLMVELVGDPDDPFDDIKLIVTMFNALQGTASGDVQESLYLGTYGEIGFYTDPAAKQAFEDRITHILEHRNPYFDAAWKDLDIIAAWEPMNEPGIHTRNDAVSTDATILAGWLGEMAAHIKSIDPDTLVSSGTSGGSGYWSYDIGDRLPDLIAAGGPDGVPGVDVYTLHYYGEDPGLWLSDAGAALPAGKRLWVTEFGDTRTPAYPATYDPGPTGVLGKLHGWRLPWMFWRMGIRTEANTFSRFTWDADWDAMAALGGGYTRPLEDFERGVTGTVTRFDETVVTTEAVADGRGLAMKYTMTGPYEEIFYHFGGTIDVAGSAITFRARASTPMDVEVQLNDGVGGYTQPNPFIALTSSWTYYQLPAAEFTPQDGLDPSQVSSLAFWFKDGSAAAAEFYLDDVWIW